MFTAQAVDAWLFFICRGGTAVEEHEKIQVYIKIVQGRTVCICRANNKGCAECCERDVVTRDRFRGWQSTMKRSRYGK